jgi:hypothetical protein
VLLASSAAANCIYDGDLMAAPGTVMRHVGYQCIGAADDSTNGNGKSMGFFGDKEVCHADGTVSRNKLTTPYLCDEGLFCDMCGPARRGAAQCVSASFADQGIPCNFESNYKASGCFTFDRNQTVVPANTQIGQKTIVGCAAAADGGNGSNGNNKLEEVYINCNANWFHEFTSESVSCPEDAPICKDEGGSASCHPDTLTDTNTNNTPVYVTTDAPGALLDDDGCVVGGRLFQPGDIVKSDRLECVSDTTVKSLVQTCQSGGGVTGVSMDVPCPVGIRPMCHQCGDSQAMCLAVGVDSPADCITGANHVLAKKEAEAAAGGGDGNDNENEEGDAPDTQAMTVVTVMCIGANGKAFAVGAEMERIGFKCTGGSIVEGKIITCGADGNPTKDASLVAFDCPSRCFQCGASAPGAAVCADSPNDPAMNSFTVACEMEGMDMNNNNNNNNQDSGGAGGSNQNTANGVNGDESSPASTIRMMASSRQPSQLQGGLCLSMARMTLCAVLVTAAAMFM